MWTWMHYYAHSGNNAPMQENHTYSVILTSSDWSWCSGQTEKHTVGTAVVSLIHTQTQTHKHIWSVVPLAVQKGQFFCQGNMLLANAVRGCRRVFCSLSTSHTVCHTLCYSLSKSMKCAQVFGVTVQKTQSWITWRESKRNRRIDSKFWGQVGFWTSSDRSQQERESPQKCAW